MSDLISLDSNVLAGNRTRTQDDSPPTGPGLLPLGAVPGGIAVAGLSTTVDVVVVGVALIAVENVVLNRDIALTDQHSIEVQESS